MMISNLFSRLSNNKQIILKNVFWAVLGKFVTLFGTFFVGIFIARYLGPEKYGLMSYVISFVTLFSVISSLGLNNITVRELAAKPESVNEIMGSSFAARMILTPIAYVSCVAVALFYHSDIKTFILVCLYALYLFAIPFDVVRNYFSSIVKNEYVVKSEICRTIVGAILKVILLWFKAPLILFVIAYAFDFFLVAGGYVFSYKKMVGEIKFLIYKKTTILYLCKESYPLAISASAIILYQKIDQVMIANMLSEADVGYFSTAASFIGLVAFLPGMIAMTVAPMLVKIKKENSARYIQHCQSMFNFVVWFAILMSLFVYFAAPFLIRYTYGEQFAPSIPVLQILIWKTVGMALSVSAGQIIIIEHLQKYDFWRNVIGSTICIILNFLFIPLLGICGSAWAAVAALLFSGFFSHALIPSYRKFFKMQIIALFLGWKDLLKFNMLINKRV